MFSDTPSGKMSRIVKPLSAITITGFRCWRIPQSAIIALSIWNNTNSSLQCGLSFVLAVQMTLCVGDCNLSAVKSYPTVGKGLKQSGIDVWFLAVEGILFLSIRHTNDHAAHKWWRWKCWWQFAVLQWNLVARSMWPQLNSNFIKGRSNWSTRGILWTVQSE